MRLLSGGFRDTHRPRARFCEAIYTPRQKGQEFIDHHILSLAKWRDRSLLPTSVTDQ